MYTSTENWWKYFYNTSLLIVWYAIKMLYVYSRYLKEMCVRYILLHCNWTCTTIIRRGKDFIYKTWDSFKRGFIIFVSAIWILWNVMESSTIIQCAITFIVEEAIPNCQHLCECLVEVFMYYRVICVVHSICYY